MKRLIAIVCSGWATLLLAGCGTGFIDSMEDERTGEIADAFENSNAMNPNAMNPNALNPSALNPSAMSASAMAALQDPGSAGELSRQLLKYTVSCALESTQSFTFSWTDAQGAVHLEVYLGLMGLATSWATAPLSSASEGWVSACLASRVNWYGVPILISSRGTNEALSTTVSERAKYSKIEGAFYGNLFSTTPAVYACYDPNNVVNSRLQLRDCASGHVNPDGTGSSCGILQILGSCKDFCGTFHAEKEYYPSCFKLSGHHGDAIGTVVTTALP